MSDSNPKLLEAVADIAYLAGTAGYYSGDSRADISEFIGWAQEFETLHQHTDWAEEDYLLSIEAFTVDKLKTMASAERS